MKNLNLSFNECAPSIKDVSFKEVVIIGNGPSGIALSYFLAGNWPYWKPEEIESHPDELLKARLRYLDASKSLVEHDLNSLTNGLEGRSTNPVSLLLDSLQHPGADLGIQLPCMLKYKNHSEKEIDHVVLGKGKPGGSWHKMDPNLRTLSLSAWMSLPNLNFDDWEREYKSRRDDQTNDSENVNENHDTLEDENKISDRRPSSLRKGVDISEEVKTRALVASVAEYYENYVHLMSLDKFFRNDTVVVNVRQIKETEKCNNSKFENARWMVHGFDKVSRKPFLIACNKVVLANGGSDLVNRLGVRGENKSPPWLKYELPLLESAIENVEAAEKINLKPVVIVGAGLSAADAVIACRNAGIEVIHVFRSVAGGFIGLPQTYFPEYNMVYKMMRNPKTKHEFYQALPESTLKEIKTSSGKHFVTIQNLKNEECQTFEVSYCAVLIGSRPDLSLLHNLKTSPSKQLIVSNINDNVSENIAVRTLRRLKIFCDKCRHMNVCFGINSRNIIINSLIDDKTCSLTKSCQCELMLADKKLKCDERGVGFGENPDKAIDCKSNPLSVNKFTNELLQVPGVYALGPLVGDNFVRFIAGGALSISTALFTER